MKKTILLIDDEEAPHKLLAVVLRQPPPPPPPLEIALRSAFTLDEGLRIAQEERPDVCLLDLSFRPAADGGGRVVTPPETLAFMRLHLADLLPVIILTGHIDPEDDWGYRRQWKESRRAGACGFLRKDLYLDSGHRGFLMHALDDAILEFSNRRAMGVCFARPPRHAA